MAGPEGLILIGFAFTYLPWLIPQVSRSAIFLFYLLPAIPFMCLAIAYALTSIGWSWEAKAAQALFATGAIAAFVYFQPLLYKSTIPRSQWDSRIWFDNFDTGCKRPRGNPDDDHRHGSYAGQRDHRREGNERQRQPAADRLVLGLAEGR